MLNNYEIPDCRDQKTTGQCAAFTTAGILQILWHKETNEWIQFSTTYTYGRHRNPNHREIEGMYPFLLIKRLCSKGSIPNKLMPELYEVPKAYDFVNSHPDIDIFDEIAEKSRIDTYVAFKMGDRVQRAKNMKEALIRYRVPLFANIKMSGGYHAVPIIGWDKDKWYYMNSWGETVGNKGVCSVRDNSLVYAILLLDAKNSPTLPFTDVSNEHWAFKAIRHCYSAGLINGVDETHFAPEQYLTKAQICQVIYKLAKKYAAINGEKFVDIMETLRCHDVSNEHWAYKAINYCCAKKIIEESKDFFCPDKALTRAEFCGIIDSFIKEHCPSKDIQLTNPSFVDIENNYYIENIKRCYSIGLINGEDEMHFSPDKTLNRGHLCQIIYKLIKFIEDTEA
jgi:hypothetical protein